LEPEIKSGLDECSQPRFLIKLHDSPVFQCLNVTGGYIRTRLCHAPISLCEVNLCTVVYQNVPDWLWYCQVLNAKWENVYEVDERW